MKSWLNQYFTKDSLPLLNIDVPVLFERAILGGEGKLSSAGALVINTGRFTGRASEDKYVVRDKYSSSVIDWASGIHEMTQLTFNEIKDNLLTRLNNGSQVYACERSVSADLQFSLGLQILTTSATHAVIANHLFREPVFSPKLGAFTIFHCPDLDLIAEEHQLRSGTVIAINFLTKEILIAGTSYAGELKKAVFSVMNTLLPDHDVLPVHSGANIDQAGGVSVFFGLSGTGKTTLSTDEGKILIGDDELGISNRGIFNLEGGCYAKTYKLTEQGEPQVYQASNRFGVIFENVVLDDHRKPIFDDKTLTENGRATYPLSFVSESSSTGIASIPRNIFYLSADAMGVLPAVSKLNPDQALYYFLSGYTAKLAGTEIGIAGIKATFSHCFGAPFMMRRPNDYADLLEKYIREHSINIWLINTGWYGGPFGIGERFDLKITRSIIRAIQNGDCDSTTFSKNATFNLEIPIHVPDVEDRFLDARGLWNDNEGYDSTANHLKDLFFQNFKKFKE